MKARIVGALSAIAVLSTLLTGTFALHYSYQALKHQKQQDELAIARSIAVQVDESLAKARQAVEALSRMPVFSGGDAARQREALTVATRVTELIDGIVVLDGEGKVLAMDGAEPSTAGLLPPTGAASLAAAAATGRRFSRVYWSRGGEPLVAIVAKLSRGETQGSLAGIVALRRHSMGGLEEIRIGKSGYAYLVDEEGNVLVHPQRKRLMENLRDHPPVRALLLRGEGILEFVNPEGVAVLAAHAPVESMGWGVIVRQPLSESYAYAEHIRWVMSAAFVLSLAASLALGARLGDRLTRPLSELVRGVQKITAGDLEARLAADGDDEVARLGAAFNEMAARLKQRLADIDRAHRRVIETERGLARSDRLAAVGQLAAGLAHEINNPLNVMSGFCELLVARTAPDDPRREAVEEIMRESRRCQRLVRDLLDYARPREPRRAPVDVPALIVETLALLGARAEPAGVRIATAVEEGLPAVLADADQLKQVLVNLGLNALQAMPAGGTLTVSASGGNAGVRIAVADDGPGIPPERLAEVFNPFYTTKEEGTGLGLALCHSIVESHGGTISVESGPERGCVFAFTLPAEEPAHAAHA